MTLRRRTSSSSLRNRKRPGFSFFCGTNRAGLVWTFELSMPSLYALLTAALTRLRVAGAMIARPSSPRASRRVPGEGLWCSFSVRSARMTRFSAYLALDKADPTGVGRAFPCVGVMRPSHAKESCHRQAEDILRIVHAEDVQEGVASRNTTLGTLTICSH
jgi:hypothetical protein